MNEYSTQRGSAIIWILIAVGLFAALNFAFNSSSRTSTSLLTNAEAESYANQIIAYGNDVKSAVKRLQLRGCSDTEISFENSFDADYTNPNSPTNKSCHIFDTKGGGLTWQIPPGPLSTRVVSGASLNGEYLFGDDIEWDGVGTTCGNDACSDIIMHLPLTLDIKVCDKINKILGYSTTPQDTEFGSGKAIGAPGYGYTIADEANGAEAKGRQQACFNRTTGPNTHIYLGVVLSR